MEGEPRAGHLRIVIGLNHLWTPGGTESYALTVARALEALGHEVVLWAAEQGPMTDELRSRGAVIARTLGELDEPDVLYAQDGPSAGDLVARFDQVPLVACIHGFLPITMPPPLPSLAAMVCLNPAIARFARANARDVEVALLTQPIAMGRFRAERPIADVPQRALMLGNYLHGPRAEMVREVCAQAGIGVSQFGRHGEQAGSDPVPAIQAADIVIARGRAALEAMSCARAVYVLDLEGGDGWVTADSYPTIAGLGFTGMASEVVVDRERLRHDLDAYDPEMGIVNRDLIGKHHRAGEHAAALVDLFRTAGARGSDPTVAQTLAQAARAQWATESRGLELQMRLQRADAEYAERIADLEDRLRATEIRAWGAEGLLATRRVRAALRAGEWLNRIRGR